MKLLRCATIAVLLASACSALLAAPPKVGSLILVSGGNAKCVIVTNADPKQGKTAEGTGPLWEKVLDFQRVLEKMSGVRVPIVSPDQAVGSAAKIFVGNVPLPKGLAVDMAKVQPRGYRIVATKSALVLRGKNDGGTINALYGFLQDKLGARWFFPTELFEVVPKRGTVSVGYCNEVHNPSSKFGMFGVNTGVNDEGPIWCERMRRDEGAYKLRADPHYIGYILNSDIYGKDHPEFYPLLNGKRVIPAPGDRSAPQPCYSNPDLVKAVVAFCRKSFDDNPNALSVAIGENDSTEWCECENCRALDVQPLEKVNDIVQHSDRYFTFANQVAREIGKSHPGKLVGCLVYNGTYTPPRKIARLEPNLAIAICVDDSQYYDKSYRDRDYKVLEAWKKKGCKNIIVYNYHGLCWWWGPRYYAHQDAANIKQMAKQGTAGWLSEMPVHWPTQGPMIYMAAQMMWNVNLDSDKTLDDLFTKSFGSEAGKEVKAFYSVFEKAWARPAPGRTGKYFEGWSLVSEQMAPYRLSDLDQALAHLAKANQLARSEDTRKRVGYIADNFAYSANALRGWLTSDAMDKVKPEDLASPDKATAYKNMLLAVSQAIADEEPIYQKTLLVDPISDREGKSGKGDHFGIIRGQWEPRCKFSLTKGTALLLEYYKKNSLTADTASLRGALPADVFQAAELMSGESLGTELVANGQMEEGSPPASWTAGEATLTASPDSRSGKQSLKIAASADFGRASQSFAVKPGTKYRLDYWYKCSRPGGLYTFVNAGGPNLVGNSTYESQWTLVTQYFTVPKDANVARADVAFCSWPGKDTLVDDVSIREVVSSNLMECRKIDAVFPDWSNPTFVLDTVDQLGHWGGGSMADRWRGPEKFSASACLGWDERGLRLVVKVKDIDHNQRYTGDAIWQGDALQFGIDAAGDGDKRPFGKGLDDTDDFLYGLTLADSPGSKAEGYRWFAPKTRGSGSVANDGKGHTYSVKVDGDSALYDFAVSWDELGSERNVGDSIGFNLVVLDQYQKEDKSDVLVWLQLTPGIAGVEGQSPALWKKFTLAD